MSGTVALGHATITMTQHHGLQVGDAIKLSGLAGTWRVAAVESVTSVRIDPPWRLRLAFWWRWTALPTIWSWNPCNQGVPA